MGTGRSAVDHLGPAAAAVRNEVVGVEAPFNVAAAVFTAAVSV